MNNKYTNEDYWDSFYKVGFETLDPSSFARFSLKYIKENLPAIPITLLDLGCGNGRDTHFFAKKGIYALGIDMSTIDESPNIVKGDIFKNIRESDVYYLRFLIHTMKESLADKLLDMIHDKMYNNSIIMLETRSSKGVCDQPSCETNFESAVGTSHFRMLYSLDYLTEKVKDKFNIVFSEEDTGLAKYNDSDPEIIRMILKKKL